MLFLHKIPKKGNGGQILDPIRLLRNNITDKDRLGYIAGCHSMKNRLADLYSILDFVTEAELIDSIIYEIKSVNMRYHYYLKICKERGYTA